MAKYKSPTCEGRQNRGITVLYFDFSFDLVLDYRKFKLCILYSSWLSKLQWYYSEKKKTGKTCSFDSHEFPIIFLTKSMGITCTSSRITRILELICVRTNTQTLISICNQGCGASCKKKNIFNWDGKILRQMNSCAVCTKKTRFAKGHFVIF